MVCFLDLELRLFGISTLAILRARQSCPEIQNNLPEHKRPSKTLGIQYQQQVHETISDGLAPTYPLSDNGIIPREPPGAARELPS